MSNPQFLETITLLPVSDIYDTLEWYQRALGFETHYIHGSGKRGEEENFANYAIMKLDLIVAHFIMDEGSNTGWTQSGTGYLYIKVRDVKAVYRDVRSRDVPIAQELQEENWSARGFNLQDPSGNVIHIEQPI